MRFLVLFLLMLPSCLFANEAFVRANEAYHNGEYAKSISLYKQLTEGHQTANVHFNLGNAYYKQGNYGHAILEYRKAQALKPSDQDIETNLTIAQNAAGLPESQPLHLLGVFAHQYNVDIWTWVLIISFWLAVALFVLPRQFSIRLPYPKVLVGVLLLVSACAATSLGFYHMNRDAGIALTEDAPLRVAPSDSSPVTQYLPQGSLAYVEKTHNDFFFVETESNYEGWIQAKDFGMVWEHRS